VSHVTHGCVTRLEPTQVCLCMTAEDCIAKANQLLSVGKDAEAFHLAHMLFEKFGHPQGARIGAIAAHRLGRSENALRLYQSALALFPNDRTLEAAYRELLDQHGKTVLVS
jgi:hypothetical protein